MNSKLVKAATGDLDLAQFFIRLGKETRRPGHVTSPVERFLPKKFPSYSIPFAHTTSTLEAMVEDLVPSEDLRASSIRYVRDKAEGLLELAAPAFLAKLNSLAPQVLDGLDTKAVASALVRLAKYAERGADQMEKNANSLLTKANQLIAGVDLAKYVTRINGAHASVGEGWVQGDLIGIPEGAVSMSVDNRGEDEYYLKVRFYSKRGGKDSTARVFLNTATSAAFQEAFLQAYAVFTKAGKNAKGQLAQLAARDRKLTRDELEFFASYFAVSNMGFIGSPELKGSVFIAEDGGPAFQADLQNLKHAAVVIQDYAQRRMEGEGEIDEELDSWRKDLRSHTFVKIAKTWPDMLATCLYLATRGT